mgnify:CR=1 FL=1
MDRRILLLVLSYLACADDDSHHLLLVAIEAAISWLFTRTRHYLTRQSIVAPSDSPIAFLLANGDDQAYLLTMGLDRASFEYLLAHFGPRIAANRKSKRGRKRLLDSRGSLALALHYMNSSMLEKTLCLLFGLTPAVCSDRLNEAMEALADVLPSLPECAIELPTVVEMAKLAADLQKTYPLVKNVFGFVDGVSFPVEHPSDPDLQNALYNGWKSDCTVTNVIGFLVSGCIFWARINCPGWTTACAAAFALTVILLLLFVSCSLCRELA